MLRPTTLILSSKLPVLLLLLFLLVSVPVPAGAALPVISTVKRTAALPEYDDAPNAVDHDDPAIYVDPSTNRTLVLATAKHAGLAVFDEFATVLQWIAPANRPIVAPADPPTPAGLSAVSTACSASRSGQTYGRFNNVAFVNVPGMSRPVAAVTDRGCDRVRFYAIDDDVRGVTDVTARFVPRVFRTRLQFPSPFQQGQAGGEGEKQGLFSNPLDEQSTAYGIGAWPGKPFVFVSQRHRSSIAQLRVSLRDDGSVTYQQVRQFVFDPIFTIASKVGGKPPFTWTPCREDPRGEDPQSEGIAVTSDGVLYVAFETTGVYRYDLTRLRYDDTVVHVGLQHLVVRVRHFGMAYAAVPADDDDELECVYGATQEDADATDGAAFVAGEDGHGGVEITADVEGIALLDDEVLLVSSQGDSTFHAYRTDVDASYVGGFRVWGVNDTDGIDVTSARAGTARAFRAGLMVVHNGEARVKEGTPEDINGYGLDGATQMAYLRLSDVKKALGLL